MHMKRINNNSIDIIIIIITILMVIIIIIMIKKCLSADQIFKISPLLYQRSDDSDL